MPPTPNLTALEYSIPSTYANVTRFTHINGVFRVTFLEQCLVPPQGGGSGEVQQFVMPRASVTLTREALVELVRVANGLLSATDPSAVHGGPKEFAIPPDTLQ